jgi:hypothetical protein
MTTGTGTSLSTAARSTLSFRPVRRFSSLRLWNGCVPWISSMVLLYAFISNGKTTRALIDPVAMRGKVKLGVVVGVIFLIRFIWARSSRSGGGRWVGVCSKAAIQNQADHRFGNLSRGGGFPGFGASDRVPSAKRRAHCWGQGFRTTNAALNATIDGHAFISEALEWWCGFHAVYSLWPWVINRKEWSRIAEFGAGASRVCRSPRGKVAY